LKRIGRGGGAQTTPPRRRSRRASRGSPVLCGPVPLAPTRRLVRCPFTHISVGGRSPGRIVRSAARRGKKRPGGLPSPCGSNVRVLGLGAARGHLYAQPAAVGRVLSATPHRGGEGRVPLHNRLHTGTTFATQRRTRERISLPSDDLNAATAPGRSPLVRRGGVVVGMTGSPTGAVMPACLRCLSPRVTFGRQRHGRPAHLNPSEEASAGGFRCLPSFLRQEDRRDDLRDRACAQSDRPRGCVLQTAVRAAQHVAYPGRH
jgi:hypothetical protein